VKSKANSDMNVQECDPSTSSG